MQHTYIFSYKHYYINITFFTGWHCRLSTEAENENVIYRMLYLFYYTECPISTKKIHRCEALPCDIQNCHPANWPMKLLEINLRYNKSKYTMTSARIMICLTSFNVPKTFDNLNSLETVGTHPRLKLLQFALRSMGRGRGRLRLIFLWNTGHWFRYLVMWWCNNSKHNAK